MVQEIRIVKTAVDKKGDQIKSWIDRILVFVAVFSSLTAVAVAIVAHKDAKESLKTQIDSVDEQIKVQQASVEPVVVVEPISDVVANETSTVLHFRASARGQTPAIAVVARIECANHANDFSELTQRLNQPAKTPLDDILIGALADKDVQDITCFIDQDPITKSLHAKIAIRFTYSDVFENQHEITYFLGMRSFVGRSLFRSMLPPQLVVKNASRRQPPPGSKD